ncbi:MAG: sigE 1 [Akkermansiaceae bacterium]|nr:sigE 1 [Akkermansiaceae bacterium]
MIAVTDAALLTAFARQRDEKAFRTLAERHFGLIFHTALRRTGNRVLAQDVSQEVLCIVARKAAFLALQPERLPSWLHRTTLFECTTAMRKESSQQRRLQRAHLEEAVTPAPLLLSDLDSSRWQRALPHLDQALDDISESDRRILLLHFFESLSFPRIATLLGRTPTAVQKQSVRALIKLNRSLSRKGIAFSITVLVAGLAAESAKAAPLALLPSFTAKAIAGSAGLSTASSLSLMIATHQKILVPCALLLLAVPLALQQVAIANAEQRLSNLTFTAPLKTTDVVAKQEAGRTGGTQISASLEVAKLVEEARLAIRAKSLRPPLRRKLQALTTRQLSELLHADDIGTFSYDRGDALATLLADILGSRDRRAALDGLMDAGWKGSSEPGRHFRLWIASDPAAAEQWLLQTQERPDIAMELAGRSPRSYSPDSDQIPLNGGSTSISTMQGILMAHLVASDPQGARRYLASFPPDTWQPDFIAGALGQHIYLRPPVPQDAGTYLALIRENMTGDLYPVGQRALVRWAGSGELLDALVQAPGQSPEERRDLAVMATRSLLKQEAEPRNPPRPGSTDTPPETAEHWLTRTMPDQAGPILQEVSPEISARIEQEEADLIESLRNSRDLNANDPDDTRANALKNRRFIYHLPEALKAAEKIQSPVLRAQTLWHLNHSAQ